MARAALRRAPALLVTLLCALCAAAAGGKGTGVTTSARCQERGGNAGDDPDAALFCMASNVWMHADRAWAVLEAAPGGTTAAVQTAWRENNARKVTKSITMTALPVKNAAAHISNLLMPDQKLAEGASAEVAKAVQKGYFSGVTLAIELPYPAFPHNVAHWAEVFFPVYSALRSDEWKGYPIERVLLVGIRRGSWIDWYEQSLRLALAAVPGGADVPLVFWDELQPLGQDGAWVRFEYLLSTRDQRHPATGARGFASVADARAFRDDAYRASRLEPYVAAATPILYLGPDNNTRVENEIELLEMLEGYNRTVYKMDMGISMTFDLVVRTIAVVGVLVSITGASLTNAVLLPPGGVVYELLPYRWTWNGIDRMHWNLTRGSADIHHFAWRATKESQVTFPDPRKREQFANWTASECVTQACIGVHSKTTFTVDLDELKALIDETLPRIQAGEPVWEHPWPPHEDEEGDDEAAL